MPESDAHRKAKEKAAGKSGDTEVPMKGNRRLDAQTKNRAYEIERSDNPTRLKKAIKRLEDSGKSQKVLRVPHKNIDKAADIMKDEGVSGSVTNIKGSKRRSVPKA